MAGVDYDALAAALLDRVVEVLAVRQPADKAVETLLGDLESVTAERDQLRGTVQELEERLVRADRNTAILLQMMNPQSPSEAADTTGSDPAASRDLVEALLSSLGRSDNRGRPDSRGRADIRGRDKSAEAS